MERAAIEGAAAEALAPDDAPLAKVDAWLVRAELAALKQDWDRVDELYRRAIVVLRELGHKTRQAETTLTYSLLLRKRGDIEGALDLALEAAQAKA